MRWVFFLEERCGSTSRTARVRVWMPGGLVCVTGNWIAFQKLCVSPTHWATGADPDGIMFHVGALLSGPLHLVAAGHLHAINDNTQLEQGCGYSQY